MRFDDSKQHIVYTKREGAKGSPGFPEQRSSGGRASKRWAGMSAPKPIRIKKDGKWVTYADYLRGAHWHRKRKEAFNYWGRVCMECGITDTMLQVHHTHYNDLWHEDVKDLRVYCRKCHEEEDRKRKNAKTNK
jgi:hypothetical protein